MMAVEVDVEERCGEALCLMESVLRGGGALAPEYPLVFGDARSGRVVVVREGGRVRSTCALLVRDLVLPSGELRAGLIGSVSTDPEHRGRGFASRALEAAEAALAAQGCLVALLWADEPAFYAGRGYGEVGREVDVLLGAGLEGALPRPAGVREARLPEDGGAVHALYVRHPRRARRTALETAALLAAPGVRTLVRERGGGAVAYACEGRGGDLGGVLHEWGGPPEDVLACIRAHMQRRREQRLDPSLFLLAPHAGSELVRRLAGAGAPCFTGVLAQGKLLDPDGALARIASHAGTPVGFGRIGVDRWWLGHRDAPVELDSAGIRELLLAPRASRRGLVELERRIGARFRGLPLAPFVWGLDSI